jgi:hypothetical protein
LPSAFRNNGLTYLSLRFRSAPSRVSLRVPSTPPKLPIPAITTRRTNQCGAGGGGRTRTVHFLRVPPLPIGLPRHGGKVWFRSTPRFRKSGFTGRVPEPPAFPSRGGPPEIRTPIARFLRPPPLPVGLEGHWRSAEGMIPKPCGSSRLAGGDGALPLRAPDLAEGGGIEPLTLRIARLSRPVAHHCAPPS